MKVERTKKDARERARESFLTGVTNMGRSPKESIGLGLPPLRQYWQQINREARLLSALPDAGRFA
jgi:hypothetical protein